MRYRCCRKFIANTTISITIHISCGILVQLWWCDWQPTVNATIANFYIEMVESLPNKNARNTPKYCNLYVDDNFCIQNTNALITLHQTIKSIYTRTFNLQLNMNTADKLPFLTMTLSTFTENVQNYREHKPLSTFPLPSRQDLKIGTRGVHVPANGQSEMYYSLGTSVRKVTRLNVANVV